MHNGKLDFPDSACQHFSQQIIFGRSASGRIASHPPGTASRIREGFLISMIAILIASRIGSLANPPGASSRLPEGSPSVPCRRRATGVHVARYGLGRCESTGILREYRNPPGAPRMARGASVAANPGMSRNEPGIGPAHHPGIGTLPGSARIGTWRVASREGVRVPENVNHPFPFQDVVGVVSVHPSIVPTLICFVHCLLFHD